MLFDNFAISSPVYCFIIIIVIKKCGVSVCAQLDLYNLSKEVTTRS